MFEKIDALIRKIENANEEINIILNMAKISMVDYIMIKRGEMELPEGVGAWNIQSLDNEVSELNEAIQALEKIRREILTF